MPSPIVAATLQAAGLSTLSNILAQIINAYQKSAPFSLDLIELLRFVTLSFISAPPNYKWQQFLEASFPAYPRSSGGNQHRSKDDIEMKAGGANDIVGIGSGDAVELGDRQGSGQGGSFSMRNTLTKWFIDCITMGAIMNTVAFLVIMGLMKGKTLGEIGTSVRTETITIIVDGYKIWPIASIISFSFIPVHRRIVFLSFIGLLWGIYMSLVAARV